jgi:hypothetical protein
VIFQQEMEGASADADARTTIAMGRLPVVLLYPSPGMGHLVSMIELDKILGVRRLPITIVVIDPPYNTGTTAPFLAGVSAANPSISFRGFLRTQYHLYHWLKRTSMQ